MLEHPSTKPTATLIQKTRSSAPRALPTRSAAAAHADAWLTRSAVSGDSTTAEPTRQAEPPSVATATNASEPKDMNGR
eukprot:2128266-Pyramimonas_sp.AAC.1